MKSILFYYLFLLTVTLLSCSENKNGSSKIDNLADSTKADKIIVFKSERKMILLKNDSMIRTYEIALGKEPIGKKQYEGDNKTPEGNYFINDKNPNSSFYKNLGISYPNDSDSAYAKQHKKSPGGDIKIHGLKKGLGWLGSLHKTFDWTQGCIAVTNEEMDELYSLIDIGTPIEIRK